jgi:hypothetical protein
MAGVTFGWLVQDASSPPAINAIAKHVFFMVIVVY